MPQPHNIDLDALTFAVLRDLGCATSRWIEGWPHEESALLNHVTGVLSRRRRGCDVGLRSRVNVSAEVVDLHRRGDDSTDRHGADLAVTVLAPGCRYAKTVFLQLKRSRGCQLTIQRHQLKDAYQDPRVGERSFVLAIDEESQKARIAHVRDLLDEFPRGIAAHGVSSLDWSPISRWLARWFACREAPSSDLRAQGNVEGLLENFVREEDAPDRVWVFDREPDDLYDFPEGYRPAQAWTHVALQEEGQNSEEIFDPPEKR